MICRFLILVASLLAFAACSEDAGMLETSSPEMSKGDLPHLVDIPVDLSADFDCFNFDSQTNKSLIANDEDELVDGQRYSGSKFHDGGMAYINGKWYNTVIAGNHRWITGYYHSTVDGNGVDWKDRLAPHDTVFQVLVDDEPVYYYHYDFAKTLTSVKTKKNKYLPSGFEELSDWKIPTLDEWGDLCLMTARRCNTVQRCQLLLDNLEMPFTGVLYYKKGELNSLFPDIAAFFLEYENVTKDYIYWNVGYASDGVTTDQFTFGHVNTNVDTTLHAPIKLFQKVKPIFYEADSLSYY